MNVRMLAAAVAVATAVATPAFAQGLDSKHSPYAASAYSGFVGNGVEVLTVPSATPYRSAAAYRFSGQHAGGPADLARW